MKNKKILLPVLSLLVIIGVVLAFTLKNDEKPDNQTLDNKQNLQEQKDVNTKKGTKMEFLTAQTFKEKVFNYEVNKEWKYEGELPCIIDFYADWCGPCKMIAPILEQLAEEYDGQIQIYKVDTEQEQELASVFGIRSIPSLLFVPKEGQPQMAVGALTKEGFIQAINDVLLKSN